MNFPESIVLAFSNVAADNLKHLNPELQKIRNVLRHAEEDRRINIIEHNGITYNSLSFLLNSSKGSSVTMLHFSGHSSRQGLLVQRLDDTGVISKKSLSNLVSVHRKLRFVFLNSCYSQETAQELIKVGVPYVIGTSDRIGDEAAAIVAAKFYSVLANSNKNIEDAFLLTKDYIDDPMNDDAADSKEAFRTFAIYNEEKDEYPWRLYKNELLTNRDKYWTLNSRRSHLKVYLLISIGILSLVLFFANRDRLFSDKVVALQPTDSAATKLRQVPDLVADSLVLKQREETLTSKELSANPAELPAVYKKQPAKVFVEPAAKLDYLNGSTYELLSGTDNITFAAVNNKLSFSGKLAGYPLSGKLKHLGGMSFEIVGEEVSGDLSLINDQNVTCNIVIKETNHPYTIRLTKKTD